MSLVREKVGEIHKIRRKTFGEKFNEAFESFMGLVVLCVAIAFLVALFS